ncbi:hypothetical protein A5888_004277 [Enterococcus sp. 9E7_DIV0242]|uniref:Uncharacterized protein n=1 Tax=Candidatus Enterococcus clewellii TaxID=1834193 RepID=A0A242KAX9_9ENTE|nr:hypothetical protein A5888_000029 [Enterococcus sp. 9E7_DIV0242]
MEIQSITKLFPFENRLRFFSLPEVRLIGKSLRHINGPSYIHSSFLVGVFRSLLQEYRGFTTGDSHYRSVVW